ncbi:hypothetical protein HerbRD11066_15860 [Herbidospora sp. RD11066]
MRRAAVPGLGELVQVGGLVDVEVVPDENDRATELLVCCDQQVPVVAPGEALAPIATAVVMAGPVDELGAATGFVAARRGDGDPSAGAAADLHHRGPAAL